MSEDEASQTEEEGGASLDASFKVDAAKLGDDEADFAKALGFGDDPPAAASAPVANADDAAPAAPTADADDEAPAAPTADADDEAPAAPTANEDDETPAPPTPPDDDDAPEPSAGIEDGARNDSHDEDDAPGTSNDVDDDDADGEPEPMAAAPDEDDDWEPIAPRPAAEGMQDELQSHADEVLARPDDGTPFDAKPATGAEASGASAQAVSRLEAEIARQRAELDARNARITDLEDELDEAQTVAASRGVDASAAKEHEKALEALRAEIDETTIERDQLVDQLAATSGQLVQSEARAEQLEASLRAARGALIPLPEGERALRAEVIGLRGRLDEGAQENVRLSAEVASVATELAIATARVEDRQHQIDFHSERAAALENDAIEKDRQLEEAIVRHREALDLATRLQSENTELRSTQAALEETLQARDLEIQAREEHLRVTRDGLAVRDGQLVDAGEQLGDERRRVEALEADLERAAIDRGVLVHKIEQRESRIATLTRTLGRIEDAMGRRITPADAEGPALAQAEWTSIATTAGPVPVPPPRPLSVPLPAAPVPPVAPPRAAQGPVPVAEAPPAALSEAVPPLAPEEPTEPVPRSGPTLETAPAAVEVVPDAIETEDDATEPVERAPRRFTAPPALPLILSRWRDRQIREIEPGCDGVAELLATQLANQLYDPPPEAIYLKSLGGGLPDAEVRLVQALYARGLTGARVDVLDATEALADARRLHVERAGLADLIQVEVGDLDDWNFESPCHAILLGDVLHAQADLPGVLERLATWTARGAMILYTGRIGSGPVQLSASTLMRLEELWQLLPSRLAEADGLGNPPFRGDDGGSPAPTYDAADLLRRQFAPLALVGFGHLSDLVVGPSRGFALSDDDAEALQLLEAVGAIDQSRVETESLPPRHGIAVFVHDATEAPAELGRAWPALRD